MVEAVVTYEPLKEIKVDTLWPKTWEWIDVHLLNINMAYQLIIILAAFIASSILYGVMRGNVKATIEKSKLSDRHKRICRSILKLLFPLLALIVIFAMTRIAASDFVGVDVWLIHGMMKVLLAWIVIRIVVQFIDNAAVRNSFSLIIWTVAALSIFGALDETTEILDGIGIDMGTFHLSLLAVIKGAFFLFALIYFAAFLSGLAERRIARSKHLRKSSQVLISKIIHVVLIIIALLIGITSSGIDLSLFAVFGGAIGLGIGFGLQKGIANLFSGMLLLFDKSIEPGDIIELDNGTVGRIERMAARYTEIITMENKSVLIPNEEFVIRPVVNWSHGNSLIRVAVKFVTYHDVNPHEVIKIAVASALTIPRVVDLPSAPACAITEFTDAGISFSLGFWINDPENGLGNVRGEVLLALWDAFQEKGIKSPAPVNKCSCKPKKEAL